MSVLREGYRHSAYGRRAEKSVHETSSSRAAAAGVDALRRRTLEQLTVAAPR